MNMIIKHFLQYFYVVLNNCFTLNIKIVPYKEYGNIIIFINFFVPNVVWM